MKTAVIGFPRIGALRELKFSSEKYFRNEITEEELLETGRTLRKTHWKTQKEAGIDFISGNDFSYYDGILDAAVMCGIIPKRYQELNLSELDTYFAMARGYQGKAGDVKALAMKKWFNTNYHYIVPEVEDDTVISFSGKKILSEFEEAKELGISVKPVVPGAYTLLKLCRYTGTKTAEDFADAYPCDMADFLINIRDRCSRAFSALGYRMDYSATKEFLENRFISLDVGDFSFSFFMALYAVMRNSADKAISIKADYDALRMSIRITVSSPAAGLDDGIYREEEIVPECAAEIKLCEKLPCYAKRFSYSVKRGVLSASASLDACRPNKAAVRSISEKLSYRSTYAMLSFMKAMLSDYFGKGERH